MPRAARRSTSSRTTTSAARAPKKRPVRSDTPHELPKIRVMISSRAMTPVFDGETLSAVRARLRDALHAIRWAQPGTSAPQDVAGRDQALFDVWTHEAQAGAPADRSTTQISIDEINRADVILVLYTGEAGSAADDDEIGICHMELEQALQRRPEIVALIGIEPLVETKLVRDRRFREYVERHKLYIREGAADYLSLERMAIELLQERVAHLAIRGARAGGQKLDRGQALDWNRLDLDARRVAMRTALARAFDLVDTVADPATQLQAVTVNGDRLAVLLDAIPAALSNAAARERVGQPFLQDHTRVDQLRRLDAPGIVHVVACHRSITESQALRMLGSPDAMAVTSDFGIYALDRVQKVQMLFLAGCGNETAIAARLRLLEEWLKSSGEQARLLDNAQSRQRILQVIAQEAGNGTAVKSGRHRR